MANYLQPNEYQTYQSTPYQLPVQQIVQAVQTRNAYWDSAMSNLRNTYQNYLGLDLTRQDNHQRLQGLMQGVNDQLKSVSKTDLSLGENYGKALSIFDPIVKDDNIMGDNAITKHYRDQFQIGQNLRTVDGGKAYSDTNMRDLSNHLSDFASDPSANNWRQHYSNRSFYTPYTDYSAEVSKLGREFKPDTKVLSAPVYIDPTTGRPTTDGKNGVLSPFMLTQSDKSILASQYRAFIDAHLSEKAKGQISLEGRVKYHDNIGALAQDYSGYNQDKINSYTMEMERLDGALKSATPAQRDVINSQMSQYKSNVDQLKIENAKLGIGDYSNLTPYKNQIASQIYSDKYMSYLGRASASTNIEMKYSPNKIWEDQFKEDQENKRFNIAKQVQLQIAEERNRTQLTIHGLKIGADGLPTIQTYGPVDEKSNESFGIKELNGLKTTAEKEYQDATDHLRDIISEETGTPFNKMNSSVIDGWQKRNEGSHELLDYRNAAQRYNIKRAAYSAIESYTDNQIKTKYPEIFNARENALNNVKNGETLNLVPYTGSDVIGLRSLMARSTSSLNLSAQDIKDVINGTSTKGKLVTVDEPGTVGGPGGVPQPVTKTLLEVNGNRYVLPEGTLNSTLSAANRKSMEYDTKRNELLNENMTRVIGKERIFEDDKNPIYKGLHNEVTRVIAGQTSGEIKPEDVMVTARNAKGDIYFKVQGSAKLLTEEIQKKVEASGGSYSKANDEYTIPQKLFGELSRPKTYDDPRLEGIQTLVDFKSAKGGNEIYRTPTITLGNRSFDIKVIMRNGNSTFQLVDPTSGAKFGMDERRSPFTSLSAVAAFGEKLGNLPDIQYLNYVRGPGNVPDFQPN